MCNVLYRLKAVKTPEELSDVYAQFSLYYGRDLVEMQHRKTAQKRRGDTEDQVSLSLYVLLSPCMYVCSVLCDVM